MRPTWPNLGRRCAPDSFASQANRQSQRQRRQRQRERDTETETETDRERDGERDNRDRRPNMVARFSHVVDAGVLAFERRGRGARRRTSFQLQRLSQGSQGSQPPPVWRMLLGCPMHVPAPTQTSVLARFVCNCLFVCGLLRLDAKCVAQATKT